MTLFTRYFSSHGRIGPGTWLFKLFAIGSFACAFGMLAGAVFGDAGAALVAGIFLWSFAAISGQRLHDIGLSAHRLWLFAIPLLGALWLLFVLLRKGTPGSNQYGSDPASRLDYLRVDVTK